MTDTAQAQSRQLEPCPASPNCVSSLATDEQHRIAPLVFDTTPQRAWQALIASVEALPRSRLIAQTEDYLHAEVTSLVFRFVDDVEFVLDAPNGQIHVRSASRTGYSDFGVNRRRVETLRKDFRQRLAPSGNRKKP